MVLVSSTIALVSPFPAQDIHLPLPFDQRRVTNTGQKVKSSTGAWEQGWQQPSLVLQLGYLVRTLNLVYSHVEKKIIPNLDFGI